MLVQKNDFRGCDAMSVKLMSKLCGRRLQQETRTELKPSAIKHVNTSRSRKLETGEKEIRLSLYVVPVERERERTDKTRRDPKRQ